ncbi:MAG: hypothetical protein DMG30_17285 [Acidobacteria bacterium]|nr:MAG: hypothetical protein DMG30_17285 [Acidobacteriota bacterium]
MEDLNRNILMDELNHKLLETEENVAKIKLAMKTSVSVRRVRRLVTELKTAMGNKDALESQLARLHLPTPCEVYRPTGLPSCLDRRLFMRCIVGSSQTSSSTQAPCLKRIRLFC